MWGLGGLRVLGGAQGAGDSRVWGGTGAGGLRVLGAPGQGLVGGGLGQAVLGWAELGGRGYRALGSPRQPPTPSPQTGDAVPDLHPLFQGRPAHPQGLYPPPPAPQGVPPLRGLPRAPLMCPPFSLTPPVRGETCGTSMDLADTFYRRITSLPGDQAPVFMVKGIRGWTRGVLWGSHGGHGSAFLPGTRGPALCPRAACRPLLCGHHDGRRVTLHSGGVPQQVQGGWGWGGGGRGGQWGVTGTH